MSLVSRLNPWKPATIAILPSSRDSRIRSGVTSAMRAFPCTLSVTIPAWEPVKDCDFAPSALIAIASRDIEMRSPEVSNMSSSRGDFDGSSATEFAKSRSSSVVSPMAETTTTTWLPALWVSITRLATCLILSASPTDEPPNFCTIRAKTVSP